MAREHLPRPWLLAALADVPVTILAEQEARDPVTERREHRLLRAEPRRRRLGVRHWADQWPDEMYGEDYWQGADGWHELEAERAN